MIAFHLLPWAPVGRTEILAGIGRGLSRIEVTRRMLDRRGVRAGEPLSHDTLGFSGGFFAGLPGPCYQLGFVEDEFRHAAIYFRSAGLDEGAGLYARLLQYMITRFCWMEPQPQADHEIESHGGSSAHVGITMGLARIDTGYLVTVIFNYR